MAQTSPLDDSISDQLLVEGVKAGDPLMTRRFVERYQGVVLGLCMRMLGQREDAEDVTQETFLRAIRAISGFDGTRMLRPWLIGIAANRCRTALSSRSKRLPVVDANVERPDPRPGISDPDDLASELERALNRLRPDYRLVFLLFHDQGLPYEEISQTINRPIGTIKTWLHRARAEMAEYLSRRGVHC